MYKCLWGVFSLRGDSIQIPVLSHRSKIAVVILNKSLRGSYIHLSIGWSCWCISNIFLLFIIYYL